MIANTCPDADFEAGTCPDSAVVGRAVAASPLQSEPLVGNVYLVPSLTGNFLPDLGVDLKGRAGAQAEGEPRPADRPAAASAGHLRQPARHPDLGVHAHLRRRPERAQRRRPRALPGEAGLRHQLPRPLRRDRRPDDAGEVLDRTRGEGEGEDAEVGQADPQAEGQEGHREAPLRPGEAAEGRLLRSRQDLQEGEHDHRRRQAREGQGQAARDPDQAEGRRAPTRSRPLRRWRDPDRQEGRLRVPLRRPRRRGRPAQADRLRRQRGRYRPPRERRCGRRPDPRRDRRALQAARLHLPLLRDLRRGRLDLRLRPLRRPAQEQRQERVVARDADRARRHRRDRLGDHPAPAGLGGVRARRRLQRPDGRLQDLRPALSRGPPRDGRSAGASRRSDPARGRTAS